MCIVSLECSHVIRNPLQYSGGVSWTLVVLLAGYFFGTFSIVKENMSILIFLVFLITAGAVFLIIAGLVSAHLEKRKTAQKIKIDPFFSQTQKRARKN
jgi:predicted membrane protein